MIKPKVAVIIPAYNEVRTVSLVVKALKSVPTVDEIIVVDYGSKDKTGQLAEKAGAKVITLNINQGKGGAMAAGVSATDAQVIIFVDADFINLTPFHINKVLNPVLNGEYDMVTGVVDRGEISNKVMNTINDPFAPIRVLEREIWDKMPEKFKDGYLVDSGLHITAVRADKRIKNFVLENLKHITKVGKSGLIKGIFLYTKMWGEIALKAFMFLWIK